MRPTTRAKVHARKAADSIPLRGQALADSQARHRANRKPSKELLHRQQLAAMGAMVEHAPDRMTTER